MCNCQRLRANDVIRNCYRLKRELFNEIIAASIQTFTPNLEHLNPQFQLPVNCVSPIFLTLFFN